MYILPNDSQPLRSTHFPHLAHRYDSHPAFSDRWPELQASLWTITIATAWDSADSVTSVVTFRSPCCLRLWLPSFIAVLFRRAFCSRRTNVRCACKCAPLSYRAFLVLCIRLCWLRSLRIWWESCPTHIVTNAAYSSILYILSITQYAVRHYTYRLPSIIDEPAAVFRVYRKMSRPLVPALAIALGLNAMVASYVTYREQLSYAMLQVQMREEEHAQRINPAVNISTSDQVARRSVFDE